MLPVDWRSPRGDPRFVKGSGHQAAVDANDPLLQFKDRPVQDGVTDGRRDLRLIVGTNVLCEPALARAIAVSASIPAPYARKRRAVGSGW
jgi:hypothetical protein